MLRNIFGPLLALVGAVLAVWSPFRIWYGGRQGSDIRVDDLFTGAGATPADAALLGSLFLPLGFAALLALLGVLLRSRVAVGAAGVLVLGVTVLWMVRQGQSAGSLTAGGDGLDVGVAAAVGGGTLLLLGAAVMPGRAMRRYGEPSAPPSEAAYEGPASYPEPYEPETYEPEPTLREKPLAPPDAGHRPDDDDTLTLPPLPPPLPGRPPG
ncbi:hypothetical protein [Actinacidiphila bryophytorum]|uniref:Tryptophan-associated transmembrane protein n=1 Tax=Actinacidiphila bryophytorum TaxID=1436133 RepID=A0A9W4H0Q8_9ACTN|nr:hypothetical protein [Actinacidiphila bryophytorum]MBM9439391.1 hypothetical protein [Actinacidiphila bryophytorum]MBN6545528.1 hypothetical protein [Actinacidiphila bryophytorum]CAG7638805.1 conserved membrane hypothetical protein [Actinacidiphila bryophytorum]